MKVKNPRALLGNRVLDLLTIAVVAAFLFPYLFMVSSAFKTRLETFAYPPVWFFTPTLDNFHNIFDDMNILFYMKNSTIIAVCSTLLTIIIAIPATYSFARFRFRYKEGIAYGFLFCKWCPAYPSSSPCSSSRGR